VPGKPISETTQRVIELAHRQPQLSSSVIAERTGLKRSRVTQILHEAKRRGDPRAERASYVNQSVPDPQRAGQPAGPRESTAARAERRAWRS
jgi:hypothetical protein